MDKDNNEAQETAKQIHDAEQTTSLNSDDSSGHARSRFKGILYIIVLLALVAFAAWIYFKQPYKQLPFWSESSPTTQAQEPTIEYAQQATMQRAQKQLEQLQAELQQAKQQIQQNSDNRSVDQLEQRIQQLEIKLNQQQQTLQQLANQLPQQQAERIREWRLFEVKQTLSAAARSAIFNADAQTAIQLLDVASQQLAGIESSGALQIRQAIEEDKQALLEYQQSDATQWVVELAALKRQALSLSNKTPTDDFSIESEQATEPTNWREHLAYNWHAFMDNFFRIEKSSAPIEPVISNETITLKQQQLDLILSVAENAALKGQVELAKTKLNEASALISDIKAASPAQKRVLNKLAQLEDGIQQAAELPEVSSLSVAASQLGGRLQ
ncbi:uroporphyrinogen-III C-methyltransferase [Idiomarina sp.]|uniref:uroporphyrinogen-III C-methyltransferase n=1 Tax=Idiomarina sp. TaxID=1874361 RepID=UPI003515ACD7